MQTNYAVSVACGVSVFILFSCLCVSFFTNKSFAMKGFNAYAVFIIAFVMRGVAFIIGCMSLNVTLCMYMVRLQHFLMMIAGVAGINFFRENLPNPKPLAVWPKVVGIAAICSYSLLVLLNPFHLYFTSYHLNIIVRQRSILYITYTPLFFSFEIAGFLLFVGCAIRIIVQHIQRRIFEWKTAVMFLSILLILTSNLLYIFRVTTFDYTNIWACVSTVLLTYCVLNYGVSDTLSYVKRHIFTLFSDAIFVLLPDHTVRYANPAAEKMLEKAFSEMKGYTLHAINPRFPENIRVSGAEVVLKDDPPTTLKLSSTQLVGKNRVAFGQLIIAQDITHQIKVNTQLEYLTSFDPDTGLPNGETFTEMLERYSKSSPSDLRGTYIFAIAVENATFFEGIVTIKQKKALSNGIAQHIINLIPKDFILSCFGKNEFYIFSNGVTFNAEDFYSSFLKASRAILDIEGQMLHVNLKMGVYYAKDFSVSAKDSLANASYALRHAITSGKRLEMYNFKIAEKQALHKKLIIALDQINFERDFYLEFQPIIDIRHHKVVGAEALLRWNHPAYGHISPALFIPVIESTDEIYALGEAVIQKACAALRHWETVIGDDFKLSVNISKKQIDDPPFLGKLRELLNTQHILPRWLDFEMTETATSSDIQNVIAFRHFVRELGSSFSIDDFGSGDTSIAYIAELAPDKVKLDMSLSENSHINLRKGVVVKSVLDMCSSLDISVVVEHVETIDALESLYDQGFSLIQGYIFSRSLSAEKFIAFYTAFDASRKLSFPLVRQQPQVVGASCFNQKNSSSYKN